MKERPILFRPALVRSILDGNKTQTRRVLKTPNPPPPDTMGVVRNGYASWCYEVPGLAKNVALGGAKCPYGDVGDRLWVRESGWYSDGFFAYEATPLRAMQRDAGVIDTEGELNASTDAPWTPEEAIASFQKKWKRTPSIHMPRWACRLVLEVTDVRLQQLREITDKDAWAEGTWTAFADECARKGWAFDPVTNGEPVRLFRESWNRINAKRGYGWDANPWVWAITFQRVVA